MADRTSASEGSAPSRENAAAAASNRSRASPRRPNLSRHRPAPKRAWASSRTWPHRAQATAASSYRESAAFVSPRPSVSAARALRRERRYRSRASASVPSRARSARSRSPAATESRTSCGSSPARTTTSPLVNSRASRTRATAPDRSPAASRATAVAIIAHITSGGSSNGRARRRTDSQNSIAPTPSKRSPSGSRGRLSDLPGQLDRSVSPRDDLLISPGDERSTGARGERPGKLRPRWKLLEERHGFREQRPTDTRFPSVLEDDRLPDHCVRRLADLILLAEPGDRLRVSALSVLEPAGMEQRLRQGGLDPGPLRVPRRC